MSLDLNTVVDMLTDLQTATLLRLVEEDDVEEKVAECVRRLAKLDPQGSAAGALDLACLPTTAVARLRELKEMGKRFASVTADPADRAAARLLYHLSSAAALATHDTNISGLSAQERRKTFADLATMFGGHRIGEIFEQAGARIPQP